MKLASALGSARQKLIGPICKHQISPLKVTLFIGLTHSLPETGCKMPVFHTKTIESILEPVAQQVSNFLRVYVTGVKTWLQVWAFWRKRKCTAATLIIYGLFVLTKPSLVLNQFAFAFADILVCPRLWGFSPVECETENIGEEWKRWVGTENWERQQEEKMEKDKEIEDIF